MNRLIIIIHTSDIIRRGLAAILRGFFNTEILQIERIDELNSYRHLKNHSMIIIIENSTDNNAENIQFLKNKNQIKLIDFCPQNPPNDTLPLICDHCINLETQAFEIQEIISECWKTSEKSKRSTENEDLSFREKEVLRLVAMGLTNKMIAEKLYISIHTVISHRKNITEKTGIKSISGLTIYAILNNLIDTNSLDTNDLV